MLLFIIGLIFGFVIGLFLYAQMLLPVLYSLPKSIYLYLKGKVRFGAIIFPILTPLFWFIALVVLGFILEATVPSVNRFLLGNLGFNLGQWLSIGALLLNFLTRKGRQDMADDYNNTTYERFRTDKN